MLRSRLLPTGRPTLREAGVSMEILGRHWEEDEKAKEIFETVGHNAERKSWSWSSE